jgi:dihydrofolate reductase
MSKLIMFNLITLDGFFEGAKNWDLDWHRTVVDEEFNRFAVEQLNSADRLLFGRVTYEGMAAHWPNAKGYVAHLMNSLPKFVYSSTLSPPTWKNTTLVTGSAVIEIAKLKHTSDGNSFIMGSAKLCEGLIKAGLFDEYRIMVTPTILGNGRPLFPRGIARQNLKLLETRTLASGGVILRYEPVPGERDRN